MRVLGLVPARGGSKGIARKNLRLLGGKPLLQYTAEAAGKAERLHRVLLSTDDAEIADAGRRCGLWAPFLRPDALARDDTPMLAVVVHALDWLGAQGDEYDAVCLLQPTSPFRRPAHIDACVDLLASSGADCVLTVLRVPERYNPHWVYFRRDDGSLRPALDDAEPIPSRQALPPAFHRDGSVYVSRVDVIRRQRTLYGKKVIPYEMDAGMSVNLDDEADWRHAERLLAGAPSTGSVG
jgi:CMP-N-acetylneuraminic acid synthetase